MLPVEILPVQETIVLRARGSELLILPHHVRKLKGLQKPGDFSQYFRAEALVNRPARKLFEAWLRKDQTLWPRLYRTVHKEIEFAADSESDSLNSEETATTPLATKSESTPVVAPATTAVAASPEAKTKSAETDTKDKKPSKKVAATTDEAKEAAPKAVKKTSKAKSSDDGEKAESSAKKPVKKTAKAAEDEPAKKEKTAKKAAPKEGASTKKKEPASIKAKASAEDKPKKKKG